MPAVTRCARKALKEEGRRRTRSTNSAWGENNLRLCISNYLKMSNPSREYSERMNFSEEHERAFAEYLVQLHLEGTISPANISTYVVPEVARSLCKDFGVSYRHQIVWAKYYALRDSTKLYTSFKQKGTGMGWDTQKYTFIMDDPRWNDLQQMNKNFKKFKKKDCYIFHILEDVFRGQGASGDFSSGFESSPRNSAEELEMEKAARDARGKGAAEKTSSDDAVKVVCLKKGKGKRKSGDISSDSPIPCPSGPTAGRYNRIFDSLESLVLKKRTSSTSTSATSPSKDSPPRASSKSAFEVALQQLVGLGLEWTVHEKVAAILLNTEQRAIWFTARSDADRLMFARLRGCFPPA